MIEIQPIQKAINATVTVPGSKSYTNRALLVAALAEGRSRLTGALFSDDTHYMCEALLRLGVEIESDEAGCTFEVVGNSGKIPVGHAELYIGNAGTAARSLVSYVALRGRRIHHQWRRADASESSHFGLARRAQATRR